MAQRVSPALTAARHTVAAAATLSYGREQTSCEGESNTQPAYGAPQVESLTAQTSPAGTNPRCCTLIPPPISLHVLALLEKRKSSHSDPQ